MTITAYDISFLFSEIFTLYSIKIFYDAFFHIKKDFVYFTIGAYIAYFIGTVILHFFVGVPFVNLIANIILLFVISLCYDSAMQKRLIVSSECCLIMFAVEVIVSAITKNAYIEPFQKYEYENILGLFLSRMLIFVVVMIIGKLIDMRKKKELPYWICLVSLIIPILTVYIELMFTTINGTTTKIVVISIGVIFAINIIFLFLFNYLSTFYEKTLNLAKSEQEREFYHTQCSLMQEATQDIRAFQHDITNHLMIIENMINNKNEQEALAYLINLIKSEKNVKDVISDTGNISVDSIINFKLSKSTLRNINITTDIIIPNELPIEIIDLATILINLLDNAIQALQKIENNKFLSIKMRYKKGMVVIKIQNSYNGIVKYENGEILTTKDNDKKHGYGIKNVKSVVQKYDGLFQIEHDDNVFNAEVLLYTEKML